MSNILGPGSTLGLLDGLRTAIRDLTARADKLTEESRSRGARDRLRHQALLDEHGVRLAAALAGAEADHQQALLRAVQLYEKRKIWIGTAYQSSKEHALENVEKRTGNRKYELQRKMLQLERDREASLAAATKQRQEFQALLAEEHQRLAGLEAAAAAGFKGLGVLTRQFTAAYENARPDLAPGEDLLIEVMRGSIETAGQELRGFQARIGVRLFRYFLLWVILALCLLAVPRFCTNWGEVPSLWRRRVAPRGGWQSSLLPCALSHSAALAPLPPN